MNEDKRFLRGNRNFRIVVSMWLIIFSLSFINCSSFDGVPNTTKKEVETGRALAAKIIKKYGLVKNEEFTAYLNLLGQKISSLSGRQDLNFRFGVLNTKEINAFACPGGYIFITLGVLNLLENEAELVAVLAHEISHVTLKHSGEFEDKASWSSFIIDIIAGSIGPSSGDFVSATATVVSSEIERVMFETGRQKNLEILADQAGIVFLSEMKYDIKSYLNFLNRAEKSSNNGLLTKTHPSSKDRIDGIYQFASSQKIKLDGNTSAKRYKKYFAKLNSFSLLHKAP